MGIEQPLMASEISSDKKRENYNEAAAEKAEKKSPFIKKFFGMGLKREDVVIADAKAENRYRDLLKDGKISEDEFKTLTTINLIKSEKFNALIDKGTVVFEGTVQGDRVRAMRQISTPAIDGGVNSEYEAEINGQKVNPNEAQAFFEKLSGANIKKNKILTRLGEKVEITDEDMAHTGYDML